MNIHQRPNKTLRSYVRCFNSDTILIPKLKQDVAVLALMNGLARGPLMDSLAKKVSNTLDEALSKVDQLIQIEEFNKTTEQITGGADTSRGKTTPHHIKGKGQKEFIEANPGKPEKKKPGTELNGGHNKKGTINVISGGIPYKKSQVKEHLRGLSFEVMRTERGPNGLSTTGLSVTFTDDDLTGVHLPHDVP
ncbi:hypothetical protein Cgig2_030672 [Carnegiea gigantea]|uniref:Uncharacterized protein n=1 Tax=Carnegiea gigantea TaxID=171969 RepID=A0A9Q1QB63_9CARY|nr:hypothetical protein Cgig2_030672 [Carnegiea gigantea]